jgi:predicted nucleic acid-binding protein
VRRLLVDTSVWVNHFRIHDEVLSNALALDLVTMHPMVLGELACGTPPSRAQTLRDLGRLQPAQQASVPEVMAFIEREGLFGLGCGLVDITLLASTLLTVGAELWTLDKRLCALADRFAVQFIPALH